MFHVATPVDFQDKEPEEVVTKRSIDGALGILKACLNSKTVKRVVYTSSASAVMLGSKDYVEELDESFWSDIDYIKAVKPYGGSYMISKTLTERAVLEFSEKYGLDVVTVIPSFVVGPFICPKLPGSVQTILSLAFGMYSLSLLRNLFDLVAFARNSICLLYLNSIYADNTCCLLLNLRASKALFTVIKWHALKVPHAHAS